MSYLEGEKKDESTMVKNVELAREVIKKREKTRLTKESLEAMKTELIKVIKVIDKVEEKLDDGED